MAKKPRKAAAKAKGMDVQSGQEPGPDPADKKAEAEAMFAEADAKGSPTAAELEEIRVGHQVRGY